MNFIMSMLMNEGVKYIPSLIGQLNKKMSEDEAILIVPAKDKLVVCIGKFSPRIMSSTDTTYTINTANEVECKKYILPDDLNRLMSEMKDE